MRTPESDAFSRQAAAYHEAGHCVVAYYFGWYDESVEIDGSQSVGLRSGASPPDERSAVCVPLAGWLAEWCWHGDGIQHVDTDGLNVLAAQVRRGDERMDVVSDDRAALQALLEHRSAASNEEIAFAYIRYSDETLEIVRRADIWPAVEAVANALTEHGKLQGTDVDKILAPYLRRWWQ